MDAWSILWERWMLLAFAVFPFLAMSVASAIFMVIHRFGANRGLEAELPEAAGEWLRAQLDRLDLSETTVGPTDPLLSGVEGFLPQANYIALSMRTMSGRKAVAWAVTAHEMGHVLHRKSPVLSAIFVYSRGLSVLLGRFSVAALLTTWLTGSEVLLWCSIAILAVGVVFDGVVIVDEGSASRTAWQALKNDGRLSVVQMQRAMLSLLAAWGAHVSGGMARALVLVCLLLGASAIPLGAIVQGANPLWALAPILLGLSLILSKRAIRVCYRAVFWPDVRSFQDVRHQQLRERVGDIGGALGTTALVLIALSMPSTTGRDLCIAAGMLSVLPLINQVLAPLVGLPLSLFRDETERVARRSSMLSHGHLEDDDVPSPDVEAARRAVLTLNGQPTVFSRVMEVFRVSYMPVLGWLWVNAAPGWLLGPW